MAADLAATELLARRWAHRYPGKAVAAMHDYLPHHIAKARERGDRDEAERLDAIARGYRLQLAEDVRCTKCGRPLRDAGQPGYRHSVGPECWGKLSPEEVARLSADDDATETQRQLPVRADGASLSY